MSNFLTNTQLGNFSADGVYTQESTGQAGVTQGPPTDFYNVVGGANDGTPNVYQTFADPTQDGQAAFGNDTASANSLIRACMSASPECQNFGGVRVTDGTDAAAVIQVAGAGAYATGAIDVSAAPTTGGTIAVQLVNGTTTVNVPVYTVLSTDTANSICQGLANLINASPAVSGGAAFMQPAFANGANVELAALAAGTGGNSITYKATPSSGTVTPTSATALSGGAASSGNTLSFTRKCTGSRANAAQATFSIASGSTAENPVYDLILTYPNQPAESWSGLVAYASLGGAFDAPTFKASVIAAVNGTVRGVTGSARWTAVTGSGTQPPALSPQSASGGTDGTSGINSSVQIGQDGITGRTGMYALRGQVSSAFFALAGNSDVTIVQTLQSFAQQENAIAIWSYPEGTTTQEAQALRSSYNLSGSSLCTAMDWDAVFDTVQGLEINVPPADKVAGVIVSLDAWVYPGNQPQNGVAGVDATDHIVNGQNLVQGTEPGLREQNGLLYLSYMPRAPRGPALGLPHGLMSDGATPISDVRMLKKIAADMQGILGQVVGDGMNTDPTSPNFLEPAKTLAQDLGDQYFQQYLAPQPGYPNGVITDYSFNPTTSNTQTTAQGGSLLLSTNVATDSPAQYIVNFVAVGRTVQVAIQSNG